MSGGGNKKKPTKIQGWEEAGSEFYQESYPTDAEFDAFQRDPNPKHLATLLPSKQTRAAATIRIRTNDTRTIRRQTSSRSRRESTVHRGTATTADVQVSMLPDLSENLSNEQTTWEEIMQIKSMPVPMSQKKEMKAKILNEPNLRLQGYEQLNWKRRKIWRHFVTQLKEFNAKLELWKGDLKRIEGDLKVAKKSIDNDQRLKKFVQTKKWSSSMTRSYVTVAVTTPNKGVPPGVIKGVLEVFT
ncbi:hypothetical protein MTP99_007765 [Tenebrio molitor]|nr:hypothetical protein MTP99_007765 [Tenebrio molitor]